MDDRKMLNCKKGDLAIIIRSHAGNEGKLVECIELIDGDESWIEPGARWRINRLVPSKNGNLIDSIADRCLRPLRGAENEFCSTSMSHHL